MCEWVFKGNKKNRIIGYISILYNSHDRTSIYQNADK